MPLRRAAPQSRSRCGRGLAARIRAAADSGTLYSPGARNRFVYAVLPGADRCVQLVKSDSSRAALPDHVASTTRIWSARRMVDNRCAMQTSCPLHQVPKPSCMAASVRIEARSRLVQNQDAGWPESRGRSKNAALAADNLTPRSPAMVSAAGCFTSRFVHTGVRRGVQYLLGGRTRPRERRYRGSAVKKESVLQPRRAACGRHQAHGREIPPSDG